MAGPISPIGGDLSDRPPWSLWPGCPFLLLSTREAEDQGGAVFLPSYTKHPLGYNFPLSTPYRATTIMSLSTPNSLVTLKSPIVADAGSPFNPTTAEAGSANPLVVPAGAKGLVIYSLAVDVDDIAELKHNTTKTRGMIVPPGRTVFAFDTNMEGGTLFLNRLDGVTPMLDIHIHYFF